MTSHGQQPAPNWPGSGQISPPSADAPPAPAPPLDGLPVKAPPFDALPAHGPVGWPDTAANGNGHGRRTEAAGSWPREAGSNWAADPGSNWPADPGSNWPADPGSNWPADPGSNWPAEPGSNWPAEPGSNWPAEPEYDSPGEAESNWPGEAGTSWPAEAGYNRQDGSGAGTARPDQARDDREGGHHRENEGDPRDWTGRGATAAPARRPQLRPHPVQAGDERLAMLGYLGVPFLGFLVPLVIYVIKRRRSSFVRDQAAQALNLSITALLYTFCALIVGTILAFDTVSVALILAVPLVAALWIATLAYVVRAAAAASRRGYFRIPAWICATIVRNSQNGPDQPDQPDGLIPRS